MVDFYCEGYDPIVDKNSIMDFARAIEAAVMAKMKQEPKRYFKIVDDSNLPMKNLHNVRTGAVLEYVRHVPELEAIQLKRESGFVTMSETSVEEVLAPVQQVGINGLTEAETDASASVMGLTDT